jgi:hypothetical protein
MPRIRNDETRTTVFDVLRGVEVLYGATCCTQQEKNEGPAEVLAVEMLKAARSV